MTIIGSNQLPIQLCSPLGIFIDDHQNMFVAYDLNNRIVEWNLNSINAQIVAGGNENQLKYPTDVIIDKEDHSLIIADWGNRRVIRWSRQNNTNEQILISNIDCFGLTMDKNGSLYVSDYKKNEVRRWRRGDEEGTIVAGGNGEGDGLNQLNGPTLIFVDEDYSLFLSDSDNHRVMKWIKDAKEGIVVAGGNGQGNRLRQLSSPRGVIVDRLGQIYVADCENHRVMRWCEGCKEGTIVVGGNGDGRESNQLNYPVGLSFDKQGNLYVTDNGNNRIQKFEVS
jgi:sugar lactone lactonase YvrE